MTQGTSPGGPMDKNASQEIAKKTMVRYLLIADPLPDLNPYWDTGIFISPTVLDRGIEFFYCDVKTLDLNQNSQTFLSAIPCEQILQARRDQMPFWKLGPRSQRPVSDFDVILQRKDPPVDDFYSKIAAHFSHAPMHILQINNPRTVTQYSEHELPSLFPEYAPRMHVAHKYSEFTHALQTIFPAVSKPHNTFGGTGLKFWQEPPTSAELHDYWNTWGPRVIIQEFIPNIAELGDLRVLVFNHHILGAILRKPAPGSLLANIHQGGSAHFQKPSPRQVAAAEAVSQRLCPEGLYFLGLDFIGDKLTEVNVTCPTLVKQISEIWNKRADVELIDLIETLRKDHYAPLRT